MNVGRQIGEVFTTIAVVALIAMMARPGSRGPTLINAVGSAYIDAARATIGATVESDDHSSQQQYTAPIGPGLSGGQSLVPATPSKVVAA